MSLTLILALQAVAAPAAPASQPPRQGPAAALDFDLARYRPATEGEGCGGRGAADVLVCGRRRGGAYPIEHWARIFGPEPPIRAEMGLGGNVTGRVYTDAVPMDRGAVSNRAMVGIKLPF